MSRKNHIESLLNRLDEQTEKDYQKWDKGDCSEIGLCEILLKQLIREHKEHNGEVAMVETFDENGKLKGERVTFTTSGVIKHYTEWKDGIKVGKEIFFDEKGYPTEIIYHKNK